MKIIGKFFLQFFTLFEDCLYFIEAILLLDFISDLLLKKFEFFHHFQILEMRFLEMSFLEMSFSEKSCLWRWIVSGDEFSGDEFFGDEIFWRWVFLERSFLEMSFLEMSCLEMSCLEMSFLEMNCLDTKNSVWKFLEFTHILCNFSIESQMPFLEWHLEVPHNICKLKGPEQGTNKKKSWNILRAKMQLALYHNWWVQDTVWKNENFTLILSILSWNQLAK